MVVREQPDAVVSTAAIVEYTNAAAVQTPSAVLSDEELREQLSIEELDSVIADAHSELKAHLTLAGLAALRMGRALIQIRDEQLYHQLGYGSYETYCLERHGISPRISDLVTLPIYRMGLKGYRDILLSYSVRKAYVLSIIASIDATAFTELTKPNATGIAPAVQLTTAALDAHARLLQERDAEIEQLKSNLSREMGNHDHIVRKLQEGQGILQRSVDVIYRDFEGAKSELARVGKVARLEEQQRSAQRVAALEGQIAQLQAAQQSAMKNFLQVGSASAVNGVAALAADTLPHGQLAHQAVVSMLEQAARAGELLTPERIPHMVLMLQLFERSVTSWRHVQMNDPELLDTLNTAQRKLKEAVIGLL